MGRQTPPVSPHLVFPFPHMEHLVAKASRHGYIERVGVAVSYAVHYAFTHSSQSMGYLHMLRAQIICSSNLQRWTIPISA